MNALPKLVASHSLKEADWNNARVTDDIASELRRLKAESEKDTYLIGSAELTDYLLGEGLVDELMLCVVPVLIGKGNPFFKAGRQADLTLAESRQLENGGVILRYTPAN